MVIKGDISEELANMSLVATSTTGEDISPCSSQGGRGVKLHRMDATSESSKLFSSGASFLDPLLYLRVPTTSTSNHTEYAQTVFPDVSRSIPTLDEILAADKERVRLLTDFRSSDKRPLDKKALDDNVRKGSKNANEQPVKIPGSVYRFCKEHGVKHSTVALKKSFRSLAFRKGGKDPWDSFIEENMLAHFRLCHAVYFGTESGGRVVCLVPHIKEGKVSAEFLSSILNVQVSKVSLGKIQKDLGLPTFVAPPFAVSTVTTLTVIDASLVEPVSTDCIFELGPSALRIRPVELGRLAKKLNWTIVRNLNHHLVEQS